MYPTIVPNQRPIRIIAASLLAVMSASVLLSGCAHELTEFEKQQIWLEKNYPDSKKQKQNKNASPTSNKTLE